MLFRSKHKNNNAYSGNRSNSNLRRWFKEDWRNEKGNIGYENKSSIYRPTKRINSKTPTTFSELTSQQIQKAKQEKSRTGKVKRFNK